MNCERYQEQIGKSALGTLEAARESEIQRHLTRCATCHETYVAEVRLLENIERGLARSLDGQPSPEFAARVRVRVAAEGERARARFQWIATGQVPRYAAVTVLALLLVGVWLVHYGRPPVTQVTPAKLTSSAAASTAAGSLNASPKTAGPLALGRAPAPRLVPARITARAAERGRSKQEDRMPQLQVLVEPGQWAAVTKLYGSIWAPEPVSTSEPVSSVPSRGAIEDTARKPVDDLSAQPIQIAPLEIASLDPVAADAGSGGQGHKTQPDER